MGYVQRSSWVIASRQAACSSSDGAHLATSTHASEYVTQQSPSSAKHGAEQNTSAWSAHASSMVRGSLSLQAAMIATNATRMILTAPQYGRSD